MSLSKPTLTMLGKLIPRLGSNHDGEVVATVRAIQRVLNNAGADLHDLCGQLGMPARVIEWREDVELCRRFRNAMSPREQEFIETLEGWRSEPSEKQMAWLQKIVRRFRHRSR
jgi:hypothetical protein